ncbi:CVNH domain-containing protein [Enterovirga sp. CN4-39]|uniref:CVNH domain-containing protein n=1 Tax=Enterovirga sp. CN4-39 TaxID=3400910 RepID=UPI003C037842
MRGFGPSRLKIALSALAIAGSAMLAAAPAQAQYGGGGYGGGGYGGGYDRPRRDDFDGPRRGGFARGSFAQSCRDIQQDGPYLSATCRMRGGGWRPSRIDTRSCRSIGNNNGRLACE